MPERAWRFKSSHPHCLRFDGTSPFGAEAGRIILAASLAALALAAPPGGGADSLEVVVTLPAPALATRRCGRSAPTALGDAARRVSACGARSGRRARATQRPRRDSLAPRSAGATGSSPDASRSSSRAPRARALSRLPGSRGLADRHATALLSSSAVRTDRRRPLWGPTLATAGEGMKIGIIDDGIDQGHPFFNATG